MKKFRSLFLLLILFFGIRVSAVQAIEPPSIAARSWLLLDAVSGQILASHDAYKRIDPASLTKMMTAYLVFDAVKEKRFNLNQSITPSEKIWTVEKSHSKMFLQPQTPVRIQDLLYGLIVQSGDDATMVLADEVAGSEKNFVTLMNREAEQMGMKSTHFSNPYGFSDKDNYSTAYDLSILAINLIRDFPELYKIYSIRDFTYNRIHQRNHNRLLWLDPAVDGIESGHTDTGGYSLIASAKREGFTGERRMMAVVIGATSDQMRAQESLKLLNWGFENFDTIKLFDKEQKIADLDVWKASKSEISVGFDFDVYVSVPKGEAEKLKSVLEHKEPLIAPINENNRVGTLKVMLENKVLAELPVVALEPVSVASFLGRFLDTVQLWFK